MTNKELRALRDKAKREMPYFEKSLERDSILFKWKSNTEGFKLPFRPELLLTIFGSIGYDKVHKCWVVGEFNGIFDEYGDYETYICHNLSTTHKQCYNLKNHDEVIVCGNTPLFRSYNDEREFYSYFKAETDKSIFCQLVNSRLSKAVVTDTDNKKKELEKAFENIHKGLPVVFTTGLLESLETVDLTDPADIEKMQYLSSFYQNLEKREANDSGVDLESLDKRAQVSTEEINQYGDVTTLEYLVMWEMRQAFVEEMKENGFDIEIVRNPVFFDEPTKEDVDNGTFEAAEAEEEVPQEETPEENKEEDKDNADTN